MDPELEAFGQYTVVLVVALGRVLFFSIVPLSMFGFVVYQFIHNQYRDNYILIKLMDMVIVFRYLIRQLISLMLSLYTKHFHTYFYK